MSESARWILTDRRNDDTELVRSRYVRSPWHLGEREVRSHLYDGLPVRRDPQHFCSTDWKSVVHGRPTLPIVLSPQGWLNVSVFPAWRRRDCVFAVLASLMLLLLTDGLRGADKAPVATAVAQPATVAAATEGTPSGDPVRGYRFLTQTALLPADFDDDVFNELWTAWPKALREQARSATPEMRRKLAFERYGLVESPDHPGTGPALGYVDGGNGQWVMNCLACHSGTVEGKTVLGVPNSLFAMQTLTEEVRQVKLRLGKPLTHLDLGSLTIPLGQTIGTTNAVIFGVALGARRDRDINFVPTGVAPPLLHHDCDAPPFWNVRRKQRIYADGFAAKSHRPLLQFVMVPQNSGERIRGWEEGARDLLAWMESLRPPRYPHPIDQALAVQGKVAFERSCARCHGTYLEGGNSPPDLYPNKIVPIEEIGTDRVRFDSLRPEYREFMARGWFGTYGARIEQYRVDTPGYLAPPLDGVWASAPYFHNGSVPTLAELLEPESRPTVWKRTANGYDRERVGLEVERLTDVPPGLSASERRWYYDTRKHGKGRGGHTYPDELSDEERRAVLEYLKTL